MMMVFEKIGAVWDIKLQSKSISALSNLSQHEIPLIFWLSDNDEDNQDDLSRVEEAQLKEEERKGDMERMLDEAEANIEQLDPNR